MVSSKVSLRLKSLVLTLDDLKDSVLIRLLEWQRCSSAVCRMIAIRNVLDRIMVGLFAVQVCCAHSL